MLKLTELGSVRQISDKEIEETSSIIFPKSTDMHLKGKLKGLKITQLFWTHSLISTHARNHTLADPCPRTPSTGFLFNMLQL